MTLQVYNSLLACYGVTQPVPKLLSAKRNLSNFILWHWILSWNFGVIGRCILLSDSTIYARGSSVYQWQNILGTKHITCGTDFFSTRRDSRMTLLLQQVADIQHLTQSNFWTNITLLKKSTWYPSACRTWGIWWCCATMVNFACWTDGKLKFNRIRKIRNLVCAPKYHWKSTPTAPFMIFQFILTINY